MRVILLPPLVDSENNFAGEFRDKIKGSLNLQEFLAKGRGRGENELKFEQLPFNHPLFILYSSGTSGPPKCIVHSAGVRLSLLYSTVSMTD